MYITGQSLGYSLLAARSECHSTASQSEARHLHLMNNGRTLNPENVKEQTTEAGQTNIVWQGNEEENIFNKRKKIL